ncbi:MAG TPA: glycosyltransferase family 39 protein [Ktedonobacterales bacterium]
MRAADTREVTMRVLRAIPASWRPHALPLGAAVLVGALLRLLWLGDTSFLGDQAQLLALGRSAADHHAFIVTGIPSSIGALNMPISDWLYAPFAVVGGPLGATLFTALANIAAVALLYLLAARYLSRLAAFAAALLYATASGPVHYARFIWQQNLLAPIILLFIWVIALAVVERRRGWLGWAVLLWGVATGLHPTAAPLLGLIAMALAFTWRDVRRRDLGWTAAALVALFGPTLMWELVSHGADLKLASRFTQGHASFDTWAFTYLVRLVQPAPPEWLGAGSSYRALGVALIPLGWLIAALLVAAEGWLVWRLLTPWLARGLAAPDTRGAARLRAMLRAGLRAGLAERQRRVALILALWQALPLAFMLRHSRPVEPHYLLVLLPGVYLCIGGFLAWAAVQLGRAVVRQSLPVTQGRLLAPAALIVALIGIGGAQTFGVASELATIHSGVFDGLALPLHYGVPLSSQLDALDATQAAARRLHAAVAIASTAVQQESLGYLNATDSAALPATDYISAGCVALPAANAMAPLVTLALPSSDAAALLPDVVGAHTLGAVAVQGAAPYRLYAITPGATIHGALPINVTAVQISAPHPAAYAYTTLGQSGLALAIHWRGAPALPDAANRARYWDGADPLGAPIANYTFTVQALDAHGDPLGAPLTTTCGRLGWSRALSLVTLTMLPASLRENRSIADWRVTATMALATATRPTLGPLPLESGAISFGPPTPLGQATTFAANTP